MRVDKWFPRCYDLSQAGQTDDLIDDYQRTCIQNIIKKHYKLLKKHCNEKMVNAFNKCQELKTKKENGKGAYNYKEDKGNMHI